MQKILWPIPPICHKASFEKNKGSTNQRLRAPPKYSKTLEKYNPNYEPVGVDIRRCRDQPRTQQLRILRLSSEFLERIPLLSKLLANLAQPLENLLTTSSSFSLRSLKTLSFTSN